MANVQLNSDVYAHLVSFVESPSDLLAMGLANKELLSLAEPEIIYRSIRCKLGNNAVWEHLISHAAQATRVRRLEIMRENPSGFGPLDDQERVPEDVDIEGASPAFSDEQMSREDIEHSESLLIRAIKNMTSLENFTWDRWVPAVNQGDEAYGSAGTIYGEDIWTALRDHTQLKELKVVDLGRRECCFPDPRPIFSSSLFTLCNLTHLELKMYYSPQDPHEGENGDDEDSDEELLPPRVNLERLHHLLYHCPSLESLTLTIIDRDFYWTFNGNPFANCSPIFSSLNLANLHTLILRDVTVKAHVIADFLNTHPRLRHISASLSLSEDDLPETPFALENYEHLRDDLLPSIEVLNLPTQDLRPILRAMKRVSPIHSLGIVCPQDWYASEELDYDENYVSSLDDVWGAPPEGLESEVSPSRGRDLHNLLTDMPNLQEITVKNLKTVAQLTKLIGLTPQMERITFVGAQIESGYYDGHTALLPHLSLWPRLTALRGSFLWPAGYDIDSQEIQAFVDDLTAACPMLHDVTWVDNKLARIIKTESGEARLELDGKVQQFNIGLGFIRVGALHMTLNSHPGQATNQPLSGVNTDAFARVLKHEPPPPGVSPLSPVNTPMSTPERPLTTPRSYNPQIAKHSVTDIRSEVARSMDTETLACEVTVFAKDYLPWYPSDNDVATCKKAMVAAKLLENKTWLGFTNRLSDSSDDEPTTFRRLNKIVDGIYNLTSIRTNVANCNQFKFGDFPHNVPKALTAGCNFKLDAAIVDQRNSDGTLYLGRIITPFELKKRRTNRLIVENRIQLLGDVKAIFDEDPRRNWIYGVTIEDTRMTVWYFSRSHTMKSRFFNWMTDHDAFLRVWLSFAFATQEELGLDPLVHQVGPQNGELKYVYEFPGATKDELPSFFLHKKSLHEQRTLCISGRNTRICTALSVESVGSVENGTYNTDKALVVIKDAWLDATDPTEVENQANLFKDIDAFAANPNWKNDRCLQKLSPDTNDKLQELLSGHKYKDLFLTHLHSYKGALTKPRSKKAWLAPRLFRRPFVQLRNRGSSSMTVSQSGVREVPSDSAKLLYSTAARGSRHFAPKRRSRFVFKEVCTALHSLPALGEVMSVVHQALPVLQLLMCAGWVHRDISSGNLLGFRAFQTDEWQLKLADLEFARPFPSTNYPTHADPRTGTPHFMPHEIQAEGLIYRPDPDSDDELESVLAQEYPLLRSATATSTSHDTTNPTKDVSIPDIPIHNYAHDLESLWWIVLWSITVRTDATPTTFFCDVFDGSLQMHKSRRDAFLKSIESQLKNFMLSTLKHFSGPMEVLRSKLQGHYHRTEKMNVTENRSVYGPLHGHFVKQFNELFKVNHNEWRSIQLRLKNNDVPRRRCPRRRRDDDEPLAQPPTPVSGSSFEDSFEDFEDNTHNSTVYSRSAALLDMLPRQASDEPGPSKIRRLK